MNSPRTATFNRYTAFWYGICIKFYEENTLLKLEAMKKLMFTPILALLISGSGAMRAQEWPDEYLGLPGDNFNLYAVMKLFQESETLEGFERQLNDANSRINNLDLNGDNMVDYITVSDYVDGNVHTIVLRAALSRNESQDVAVFTVEQLRNGEVRIQLIGDEALYGRNYVIEPNYAETPNPGYNGPVNRSNVTYVTTTYYDIAAWPVVRFIYHPAYIGWRSAWYWGYYPVYWNPWQPYYWHQYYGYHYHWYPHYYGYYHHSNHYYYTHYQDHYYTHIRSYSPVVSTRIKEGQYRSTYSRPELRSEGEALYTRTNPTRSTRSQASTSTSSGGRRNSAQSTQQKRTTASKSGTTNGSTSSVSRRNSSGSPATVQKKVPARSSGSSVPKAVSRNSKKSSGQVSRTAPATNRRSGTKATGTGDTNSR